MTPGRAPLRRPIEDSKGRTTRASAAGWCLCRRVFAKREGGERAQALGRAQRAAIGIDRREQGLAEDVDGDEDRGAAAIAGAEGEARGGRRGEARELAEECRPRRRRGRRDDDGARLRLGEDQAIGELDADGLIAGAAAQGSGDAGADEETVEADLAAAGGDERELAAALEEVAEAGLVGALRRSARPGAPSARVTRRITPAGSRGGIQAISASPCGGRERAVPGHLDGALLADAERALGDGGVGGTPNPEASAARRPAAGPSKRQRSATSGGGGGGERGHEGVGGAGERGASAEGGAPGLDQPRRTNEPTRQPTGEHWVPYDETSPGGGSTAVQVWPRSVVSKS